MEQRHTIGITVAAEQIPLLRDVIVAQSLNVFINDTQNTDLLDDQWKPWVRRVKPQVAHCTADVWIWAPCYAWPDQDSHQRIRSIIAQQLQTCLQIAVMIGAKGIVLPLEHAAPPFQSRISYYVDLFHAQLAQNNLTLMLSIESSADTADVYQLIEQHNLDCTVMLASAYTNEQTASTPSTPYIRLACSDAEDDAHQTPRWGTDYVIDAHENITDIRKKLQQLTDVLAQPQPDEPADEVVDDNQNDTSSAIVDDEVS